jgi:hypothetical protein
VLTSGEGIRYRVPNMWYHGLLSIDFCLSFLCELCFGCEQLWKTSNLFSVHWVNFRNPVYVFQRARIIFLFFNKWGVERKERILDYISFA